MESEDNDLAPSLLGTHKYWNECYGRELSNHMDNGDYGDVWFGINNMKRIIKWVNSNVPKSESIIELGCGNGMLLIELSKMGFTNLFGTDYVCHAIELCKKLAQKECPNNEIRFDVCDVLCDTNSIMNVQYDVVIDKGTYDAICLSPDAKINNFKIKYLNTVIRLLNANGLFIIMSCNWTKDELCQQFMLNRTFNMIHQIETPSFSFGGKNGNTVTCLIFKKC